MRGLDNNYAQTEETNLFFLNVDHEPFIFGGMPLKKKFMPLKKKKKKRNTHTCTHTHTHTHGN